MVCTVLVVECRYLVAEMKLSHLGFVGGHPCYPQDHKACEECAQELAFDTDLTRLLRRIPLVVAVPT